MLGASTLSGCSLIYDLSPDQCGTNSDCDSFGSNYVCEEGMCKAFEKPGECVDHSDCLALDQNTPRACIEQTPGRTSSRVCVELRTEECPLILPIGADPGRELWREQLEVSNSIVIGAYGFLPADLDYPDIRNYDLALTELDQEGGIPGPNGTSRPVVAVVCNTENEANEKLQVGIEHLVRDLRVPGIIASMLAANLQRAFGYARNVEENPNVFFMGPLDNDEALANLEDQNLVWNILANGKELSAAYGPLFDRTLAYLEANDRIASGDSVRVAVLTANSIRVNADISANLPNLIRFNDASYQKNRTDGNLIERSIVSSYDENFATEDYKPHVDALIDFHPHIVIALGADEIFTKIIPALEDRWDDEVLPAGEAHPFYLLSPYGIGPSVINLVNTPDGMGGRKYPGLNANLAGVNWASVVPEYRYVLDDYLARMSALYTDRPADLNYENWYDAAWTLLYAMGAGAGRTDNFEFTGTQLAQGMERLMSGPEFEVGPQNVADAFGQLSGVNSTITLVGTMGLPDFDSLGGRRGSGSVWCVTPPPPPTAAQIVTDVLRVDENGELVALDTELGKDINACIPDF